MKPTDVVATVMNENGVQNVTAGQIASERLRRVAVAILREIDAEGYAAYKSAKFPGGVATPASRKKAYAVALARAYELALAHYHRDA